MLSDVSQSQEDKYCMIHLHEVPRIVKLIKTESQRVAVSGEGRWEWDVSVNEVQLLFGKMEKVLEMNGGSDCTTMCTSLHLKMAEMDIYQLYFLKVKKRLK